MNIKQNKEFSNRCIYGAALAQLEESMQNEILLEMKNIRKEFPGVVAVNDVSMDIRKGEVHIIIGENGAGKSTLVKMMAGLYKIDGGEMILEGQESVSYTHLAPEPVRHVVNENALHWRN